MPKKQAPRKAPKRRVNDAKPIELDYELAELAKIIAEQQLENNAAGWLLLPWRSGWNVVRLMLAIDVSMSAGLLYALGRPEHEAQLNLDRWLRTRDQSSSTYHIADDLRDRVIAISPDNRARALVCALRCVQVLIAKSDGGGHVYNDVIRAFIDSRGVTDELSEQILDARCWDAIGVGSQLRNDKQDRYRRAFRIAWARGLYQAAYAIPSAL